MDRKRVMVAGGAGFIGSALTRNLLTSGGFDVLVFDALTYAASPEALDAVRDGPGFTQSIGDICDPEAVGQAIARFDPDVIINLAAETHVDRSIDGPSPFVRTNLVGVSVLLEAALKHWRGRTGDFLFHQVSTDEVFGSLDQNGLFDAESAYDPRSPYSATKAGADHLVRAFGHTYGLPVVVSHCSNNYGPYQFPEKLVPLMIVRAILGRSLPLYGDGLNVRDWIHVDDHVAGLKRVWERGCAGSTYLFGGSAELSNVELVQRLCLILDRRAPRQDGREHQVAIEFVLDRPGHDRRYAVDWRSTGDALSWSPLVSVDDGLEAAVQWYLANRRWWEPILAQYDAARLGGGHG